MLEISEVQKNFGGVAALESVDLRVEDGEFVSLVGPNGAGKTTLVNLITGVLRQDAGQIHLDERRIDHVSAYLRPKLGIVRTFQSPRLFGRLSARQNIVASPLISAAVLAKDFEVVTDALNITEHLDYRIDQLNVVDRHRVEIARALLMQPRVLLLDEPTAGMSEVEAREVIAAISARREVQGFGILLIEHNFRLVKEVSDRLAVLDFGRLIHTGPPADIEKSERVIEAYLGRRD